MSVVGRDRTGYKLKVPGKRRGFVLDWAGRSDIGKRRAVNEDSVLVGPPVFAVADGMGGHAAGDKASAAVVERLAALRARRQPRLRSIVDAGSEAALDGGRGRHRRFRRPRASPTGAGTTVTGAALALRRRANRSSGCSTSETAASTCWSTASSHASRPTIRSCRRWSMRTNEQAPGRRPTPRATSSPGPSGSAKARGPTCGCCRCRPGMRLLLCSDGLTKEVPTSASVDTSRRARRRPRRPTKLMDAALAAGGRDNVTVVVIDVAAAVAKPKRDTAHSGPSSGGTPT